MTDQHAELDAALERVIETARAHLAAVKAADAGHTDLAGARRLLRSVGAARMIMLVIVAGMAAYRLKVPIPSLPDPVKIGALRVPVLVVLAGASPMHDAAAAEVEARRLLPRQTVRVYAGASHAINGERPDEIAADVAALLERSGS